MTYLTISLPHCAKYSLNSWHLNNCHGEMNGQENNHSTTMRCSSWCMQVLQRPRLTRLTGSEFFLKHIQSCLACILGSPHLVIKSFLFLHHHPVSSVCLHAYTHDPQMPSTAQYPHVGTLALHLLLDRSITIEERERF